MVSLEALRRLSDDQIDEGVLAHKRTTFSTDPSSKQVTTHRSPNGTVFHISDQANGRKLLIYLDGEPTQ